MRASVRDRLKRHHIDHRLKIHDGMVPKHSKLNSIECTMKAFLVIWLAEWAAFSLTTTHVLSSWNMVFTEVRVIESVDDVDLPCPSVAMFAPDPLVCVMPVQDANEEEALQVEANEAYEAELQENIELLLVPRTPPLQ